MTATLRIGTRRSALALYQTNLVAGLLRQAHPDLDVQIVEIDTKGDRIRDVPLPQIGGKGLFTAEIEAGLLDGSLELAVHSLKDLPSSLPDGLVLSGSPTRAAPEDALVSARHASLADIPSGGVVATGSVRRRAQLIVARPDLEFVDLRGNIDTRLRKLEDNGWDAIVMAAAALDRLEMPERITERLRAPDFVPAVGQGAIGLEIHQGREDVEAWLAPILDPETTLATRAERVFMRALEGGCSAPVAAHASRQADGEWSFHGWVSSTDGARVLAEHVTGADPVALANQVSERMLAAGAREIIAS